VVSSQYVITQIRARVKNRSLFSFCYISLNLLFKQPMLINYMLRWVVAKCPSSMVVS
jgi:hypothetical protein